MPIDIRPFDPDLEPIVDPLAFELVPGDTEAVEVWLIAQDGSDAASGVELYVGERAAGGDVWSFTEGPIIGGRRVRVEVLGGYGGLSVPPAVHYVGVGSSYPLPDLEPGEGVKLSLSVTSPLDQPAFAAELYFELRAGAILGLDASSAAGPDGVLLPVGQASAHGLLEVVSVEPSDPAAATVEVVGVGGLVAGQPVYVPAATVALSNLDGDGAALSSGQAYVAALYLGASGIATAKGARGATPLDDSARPALTREQAANLVAWVTRPYSGVIESSAIEVDYRLDFGAITAAGASVQVAPGTWHVGQARTRTTSPQSAVVSSASWWVWRLAAGELQATSSAMPPAEVALLLARGTTDSGSIDSMERLANWLPRPLVLTFVLPTLTVGATAYLAGPVDRDAYIAPYSGAISVEAIEDDSPAADSVELVIESKPQATWPGSWTEHTAAARRLQLAGAGAAAGYDETGPGAARIPAGSMLRARVTAIGGAYDSPLLVRVVLL